MTPYPHIASISYGADIDPPANDGTGPRIAASERMQNRLPASGAVRLVRSHSWARARLDGAGRNRRRTSYEIRDCVNPMWRSELRAVLGVLGSESPAGGAWTAGRRRLAKVPRASITRNDRSQWVVHLANGAPNADCCSCGDVSQRDALPISRTLQRYRWGCPCQRNSMAWLCRWPRVLGASVQCQVLDEPLSKFFAL